MATPGARTSRARVLQIVGGSAVALGVLIAVFSGAIHAPGPTRLGVAVVVIGVLLLALSAILRRIRGLRGRSG